MNAEKYAALGCRRGEDESLTSWLLAGPIGAEACDLPKSTIPVESALYCPACYVIEASRRRWYTRESWGPQGVVCTTHDLPLLRFDTPPKSLRSRRWPSILREEFRALGAWFQRGCGGEIGRAITHSVRARTDSRVAYSSAWAAAQWHLWAEGWPVPFAPRPSNGAQLLPRFQFDRLALMAISRRVYVALESGQQAVWGPLPIRLLTLKWLENRVAPMRQHLALCFRAADSAYSRGA